MGFETEEQAAAEDEARARLCRQSDIHEARSLAQRLEHRNAPRTHASARWRRQVRRRVAGAVLKMMEPWPKSQIRLITALPRSGEIPADELRHEQGVLHKARFRQQLLRAGAAHSTGFVLGFEEAEFEPESGTFRFHWHCLATAGFIGVFQRMQKSPAYSSREFITRPLQLDELRRDEERAEVVSYLMKGHWKQRRIGPVDSEGNIKRSRQGMRLIEPYHTQALLYLDRHSLSETSILMGCRATPSGIKLSSPDLNAAYMTRHLT